MNKGKNTIEKNMCHYSLTQFYPKHVMLKSNNVLILYIFTIVQT